MNEKLLGFDVLKGKTITSADAWCRGDKSWIIHTDCGTYELFIDDEGYGCNDSNAFLNSVDNINNIIGKVITSVDDDSEYDNAIIRLRANDVCCTIDIVHEQNGYYGFSYQLIKH